MKFIYFDINYAVKTHRKILEVSGGLPGNYGLGKLESTIEHIQNDGYYPSFEAKVSHLVFSVNKDHSFVDGNKRTSIALGAFLLELNGLDTLVNKFIIEMENIAVAVADNIIDKELLDEIIMSLLNEDDYPENLKLKIISALTKAVKPTNELNEQDPTD